MSELKYGIPAGVSTASQNGNVTDLVLPLTYTSCTEHWLQIVCSGTPSAGVVTVKRRALGGDRYFPLTDKNGVPVSLDIMTGDIIHFTGPIDSLQISMSGFAGANAWVAMLRGC